jgi:sporulation protein YlmC with PRC-barrel domain
MAERQYYLGLQLLDRQLVADDGSLVGKVDDLELERCDDDDDGGGGDGGSPCGDGHGRLCVTALLSGPGVLAQRMGRRYGAWVQRAQRALGGAGGDPTRIPFARVVSIGSHIELAPGDDELAAPAMDRWVNEHVIGHIPGSRHAPE